MGDMKEEMGTWRGNSNRRWKSTQNEKEGGRTNNTNVFDKAMRNHIIL